MKFLKRILTPPVFDDEAKTQQAYMLHIILWTLVFMPVPYFVYSLIATPDDLTRLITQTLFGIFSNILLMIFMRHGYVKASSVLQVSLFWIFFTVTAYTSNGVQGEAYLVGYTLVITVAGILLGGRGSFIFTVLSLGMGAFMLSVQLQGGFETRLMNPPLTTWFISLTLFPVIAILQHLSFRKVENTLSRARASEERYRLISQTSSDYTFSTALDKDGNMYLNWVTGAFEEITGYTYQEYVAAGGWNAHLHPEDIEQDTRDMEEIRKNHKVVTEVRTFRKDGGMRWVRVYAQPVWDEKENCLAGIVGAVQDITERKQAESSLTQERDLLQTFMDNIPDQIYFKDLESRFIRINKAQAAFLGLKDPQDAIGKTDLDFQPPDLAKQFVDEEKKIIETGSPIINRIEFNPKEDGSPRWLSATKTPVKDSQGDLLGTIGISRDITRQRLAEEREQQRRTTLVKIVQLGQHVTEALDLRSALERIWQSVRYDLNFDRLGIYLYDYEHNSVNGTYGTNNQGEMIDEWDMHISLDDKTVETISFIKAVQEPNGYYLTHNYETEHNIQDGHIMDGVKDYAAVSAWTGDKPVAVVCVDNLISGRPITDEQLEALRLFTGYAGLAIENARLKDAIQSELEEKKKAQEAEQQRRQILEKVVQLGKQVTEVSDLKTTIEKIWKAIHDELELDRIGIYFYNDQNKSLDMALGTDMNGNMDRTEGFSIPEKNWRSFQIIINRQGGYYHTKNYSLDNDLPEDHEMYDVKDHAVFAAWIKNKPAAIIFVDNNITKRPITERQVEALNLFTGYIGLAIENAQLNEAIKHELELQKQSEALEASRRIMLEKVVHLGQGVTEVRDINTTIEHIWHGVHDVIGFDRPAIFLYNQETNTVNGTLGTDNSGNIVEVWNYQRTLDQEKSTSFIRALEQPNGLFYTDKFGIEFEIPEGHEMHNVKDFASVAAWAADKPVAIITVDNNITGRKFTSTQLEALQLFGGYAGLAIQNSKLNTALQVELNQRQALINELEDKNAELERFTYTVSHDLKSPLVTITGFLGFLENDALSGNVERIKSNINRIAAAAKKMQALLNDLLELSRIGRLMNPPEDIPFIDIVNEAIDRVRGHLDEVDAIIEIQQEFPIIKGDRERLIEVVQNLIENAVKYAKPETNPRIEIGSSVSDENGNTTFHVRDNGIGIAPEYYERIFGLFNKLNPHSEGTGIGLSLVKRIIEVHNGRVWVESEKGEGATFYFSLPTSQTKE